MRYLIKYKKGYDIKFVAHLDLMRNIQRTFRRANLPAAYSKGFNPHMILSIAQPLSVGMYSDGEYCDVEFTEEVNNEKIISAFNENSTEAIKLLKVIKIDREFDENKKKLPQAMAAVDGAEYDIKIKYKDCSSLEEEISTLLKADEWKILKKTKSGEKEVNIKPMIKRFKFCIENSFVKINVLSSCGSRENLSAELLSEYIKKNTGSVDEKAFTEIKRIDLYALKNKKFIPLWKYFQQYLSRS